MIRCGALNEKRKPAPLAASQSASMLRSAAGGRCSSLRPSSIELHSIPGTSFVEPPEDRTLASARMCPAGSANERWILQVFRCFWSFWNLRDLAIGRFFKGLSFA